jgi:hypothetical protein
MAVPGFVRFRGQPDQPKSVPTRSRTKAADIASASLQTARNLGKAYYEQGKYPEAIAEFKKVTASGHALATDHLDLGLALMQANMLDAALGELTTAKQMEPKLTNIDYALGILYKRELRDTDAETALQRVTEADASDPAAWFNLGTVYFSEAQHAQDTAMKTQKLQEALAAHQRVLEMGFGRGQNFYVASLFHTFTILTRLRRPAEAEKVLKIHEKMRDKVPNISLQNPALEGGKYGAIIVPPAIPVVQAQVATEELLFADVTKKLGISVPIQYENGAAGPGQAAAHFPPYFAIGDYDADGKPDLYIVNPSGKNRLFRNKGDGSFADVTEKAGVAGPGGSISATFADYDNSGHPSLFLAGANGITLYRNKGGGVFTDETDKAGLRGISGELDTEAELFDADGDGFLDLVVTAYAELGSQKVPADFPGSLSGTVSHFYRNNGDGTFKDITASSGLESAKGRMRGVLCADFNNDGYADLVFLRDDGSPLLYFNQGEDKFVEHTADAGPALMNSRAFEGQVADFNHDGNFDLALWSSNGYQVLLNRGGGRFGLAAHLPSISPPAGLFAARGIVADLNGDGFDDLLIADAHGKLHFLANRAAHFEEAPFTTPVSAHHLSILTSGWLNNPGSLDLLGFPDSGHVIALEKQGPPSRWLEVKLDGYKSNKAGVGTIVELKAGNFYNKLQSTGGPLRVFAGNLTKLDVVRVTWPNAIVQNSIDVATNRPLDVRESERLASSCPFLYVWNGRRYRFFTDILGASPLGELLPDGTYVKPNPEELIKLDAVRKSGEGDYLFQLTDEMREADYVDQLHLFAIDHPSNEEIYANEIYSSSPSPPVLYSVKARHLPVSAVDDNGHDVLPLIRARDGQYPTNFRRSRILGVGDLHSLTLDLGQVSNNEPLTLFLTGWVFWTDSNASRALETNSQLQMVPPYLQVRDADGKWVTVIADMGLPSGTNRTMRVDLTGKFLSSDRRLRIVTNLCVYWDEIFFTSAERRLPFKDFATARTGLPSGSTHPSDSRIALLELPLISADLHYRGFSSVVSDPAHVKPDVFEYTKLTAEAPWNPFRGRYTRYGPVERLVSGADNWLVVMATGDEMTVRFSGRGLPPLKNGWKRTFFLYARGYAKDGEPNTAYSKTVEPLPFFEMAGYPYPADAHYPGSAEQQRYVEEYETRPSHLLIPPLTPPH